MSNLTRRTIRSSITSWAAVTLLCLAYAGCRQQATPSSPTPVPSPPAAELAREVTPEAVRKAASQDALRITPKLDRVDVDQAVERFYARRNFHLAWFEQARPLPTAAELVACLRDADREGLDAESYRPLLLDEYLRHPPPRHSIGLAEADSALTRAFVTYALHRLRGRAHPHAVNMAWYSTPRRKDLAAVLAAALRGEGIRRALSNLDPPYEGFARLRRALTRYHSISAAGGWPAVPDGPPLRLGDAASCGRLRALHQRLAIEGYASLLMQADHAASIAPPEMPGDASDTTVASCFYDEALATEVRRFQAAHGVSVDGTLGPETLRELNVPAFARAHQLALNMERWRWLPETLGDPCVIVNLAAFRLTVIEHDEPVSSMRVIVGKEGWNTPVFSDRIQQIVLNPYWNVPDSIAAEEILPALRKDPTYLERNGFEVLEGWKDKATPVDPSTLDVARFKGAENTYRFRQLPGPMNPLGTIKFLFPNAFAIYLHGTPGNRLFELSARAKSHGCVRLEKPLALAAYLLRDDPTWTRTKLEEAIASGHRLTISLPHPVPVHLLYWTAQERDDQLDFFPDIYGVDAAVAEKLARRSD